MKKTPVQVLKEILEARYPDDKFIKDLFAEALKDERCAIECAYTSGATDKKLELSGYEPVTADKYYFMTYISND